MSAPGNPDDYRQHWLCGRTDECGFLSSVAGWAVASIRAEQHAREITLCEHDGLVTRRIHVAPIGSWDAYALTKKGFRRLAEINFGQRAYEDAVAMHQRYGVLPDGVA